MHWLLPNLLSGAQLAVTGVPPILPQPKMSLNDWGKPLTTSSQLPVPEPDVRVMKKAPPGVTLLPPVFG